MATVPYHIKSVLFSVLPKAGKTSLWLLKIIIPVSFTVNLLHYFGVTNVIAGFLSPLFSLVGLPGDVAIVFITSIFLPLYAPISILASLPLSARHITILALMCLIAHNLIVETAVQSKTGSKYIHIFVLRIVCAFVSAYFLNLLLPENIGVSEFKVSAVVYNSLGSMLTDWVINTFWLIIKIILIISGLMILQNILKEMNLMDRISAFFTPLMVPMGLPKNCSFLWFVAHVLGLAYGSAVMIDAVENKELSKEDANLLNHHIAVNHSTLEDTLLFAAIGVPVLWMIIPRFILAIFTVWFVRFLQYITLKKERMKIIAKSESKDIFG